MVAPVVAAAIPAVLEIGGKLIERLFPDKTSQEEAKIRLLELAQQGQLAELANVVEQMRVDMEDRASARQREIALQTDKTTRWLAIIFVGGFFIVLFWLLYQGVPAQGGDALMVLLGALSAGVAAILAYYYGSSSGSWLKNFTPPSRDFMA